MIRPIKPVICIPNLKMDLKNRNQNSKSKNKNRKSNFNFQRVFETEIDERK